jgi:hypothetical protein
MTKHTPGPWRIDDGYPSVTVLGKNNITICEIYTRTNDDRDLIAAAPDLLAACEHAMRECCDLQGTPAGNAIEAAIAKARGQG